MKLSYDTIRKKDSLVKATTGLNIREFEYLLPAFEQEWGQYIFRYTFEGKPRERSRKGRKNNTFKGVEDMLVFILYDYRHNFTQEIMGLHFCMPQSKVAMWIKVLEPLLARSLDRMKLLPARDSNGLDSNLVGSVTILLDGSERPINRPKYDQKDFYSGKKNSTR